MGLTTRGLRRVQTIGVGRGLAGSGRLLGIGLVAGALRWVIDRARREEEVVYRRELEPGQRILVDHRTVTFRGIRQKRPY